MNKIIGIICIALTLAGIAWSFTCRARDLSTSTTLPVRCWNAGSCR